MVLCTLSAVIKHVGVDHLQVEVVVLLDSVNIVICCGGDRVQRYSILLT